MILHQLISIYLFVILIITLVFCEFDSNCIEKANVRLLTYDKSITKFNERFTLIDENGSNIAIRVKKIKVNNETIDKVFFIYNKTRQSWSENIIKSAVKRDSFTAYTDSPNYYYALVKKKGYTEEMPKKTMVKFKMLPGQEDPIIDPNYIYFQQYEVFSTVYFRGPLTIRYHYLWNYKKDTNDTSRKVDLMLRIVFSDSQFSVKPIHSGYNDFSRESIPHFLIPIGDSIDRFFVIYANGGYINTSFQSITEIYRFQSKVTERILIEKGPKYINKVKALIRKESKYLYDEFYILDDTWKLYSVIVDVEKEKLTVKLLPKPKFRHMIQSIKARNPIAAFSNKHGQYYAVEEDYKRPNHTKFRKYELFYGTQEKAKVFDDHPGRIHAVMVQQPRKLTLYSVYFQVQNEQVWYYLHKNGDGYVSENDTNIIGHYDYQPHSYTRDKDKTPNYIIPIENSDHSIVIYPNNTYTVIKLNTALRYSTKGALYPAREIYYQTC